MIILEGVDKAGKSTLASELSLWLELDVESFGVPEGDPTFTYDKFMSEVWHPVILDRFFFGELPYSIVKKRTKYMDDVALTVLQLMLQSIPHIVLYVRPPREVIQERMSKESDDYVSIAEVLQVYDEYDELFAQVFNNVLTVQSINTPQDIDYIENRIMESVTDRHMWKKYRKWKNLRQEGIGTLNPRYLFVGERHNTSARHQRCFWSKSGGYLFKAIQRTLNISLCDCHFTNAINPDMSAISKEVVELLQPKDIVCLGDVAKTWVRKLQLGKKYNVTALSHPAYHSRFKNDPFSYVKALEERCK